MGSKDDRGRGAVDRVGGRIQRQSERDGKPISYDEARRKAVQVAERHDREQSEKPRPQSGSEGHKWPEGFADIGQRFKDKK